MNCYEYICSLRCFTVEVEDRAYGCDLKMSVSSSSWCLGRAAVCDSGTPWTFLLLFFFFFFFFCIRIKGEVRRE